MKCQQRYWKYAEAVRAKPGAESLQALFIPLVLETSGFTHFKSAPGLGRQFLNMYRGSRLLREDLLRFSDDILERASRRLGWFNCH